MSRPVAHVLRELAEAGEQGEWPADMGAVVDALHDGADRMDWTDAALQVAAGAYAAGNPAAAYEALAPLLDEAADRLAALRAMLRED